MTVDRADVAEAHFLEQHAAVEEGFDGFLKLAKHMFDRLANHGDLVEQPRHITLHAVVERSHTRIVEVLRESSDARANTHFVVVQNDEQIFFQPGRVVHGFEDNTGGQSTIADHGHRLAA